MNLNNGEKCMINEEGLLAEFPEFRFLHLFYLFIIDSLLSSAFILEEYAVFVAGCVSFMSRCPFPVRCCCCGAMICERGLDLFP